MHRLMAVALTGTALTGVSMTTHTAAAAPGPCTNLQTLSLDLPGKKPDTTLIAEVCSETSAGKIRSSVTLHWQIDVDQVEDFGKRWTSVKVDSRLERRATSSGADSVVNSLTCDFTANLNKEYGRSSDGPTCVSPWTTFDPAAYWSGDATITYDLEGDAKGAQTWQLTGSPLKH
ncbi:hypothetical protein [Streptomyces sp. URMC 123]|uniref:hypothetical protein n=1 Tax=Streptomyces sp. URMC 123 TaxID=3423403 RepID=UPI003F1B6C4B